MANPKLVALTTILLALPAADVHEPDIPMADFLQEDANLSILVKDPDVRTRLVNVGLVQALLDSLDDDIDATRAAQSEWVVLRDKTKSTGQRALEEEGFAHCKRLMSACRWNLRNDRVALGVLSAIAEGDSVPDMIQDLSDLATLMEGRLSLFATDKTFDAQAAIQKARTLVGDLEEGVGTEKFTKTKTEAKDLRDRAYTYLSDRVSQIREAGRYAYADDAAMTKKFGSEYRRRHRSRGNEGAVPVLEPPVVS